MAGAMVTGGVIEIEPPANKFVLPGQHATFVTRPAGADNMAVFAQYIPLLGSVEDEIVECFTRAVVFLMRSFHVSMT